MAFAQIKIDGFCDSTIREEAIELISEQIDFTLENKHNYENPKNYEDRLQTYNKMKLKLEEIPANRVT
jgi:uncharacterized protein YfeS